MFFYNKNRFQQLKGFYYTALFGSPTKAADKMLLSQAAVSMQIKALEKDLRVKLFTRQNRKLSLTKEGKEFYEIIVPHIQGIEEAVDAFNKSIQRKKRNLISIAANHVSISYILPKYINIFKRQYPESKFKIKNLEIKDSVDRLLKNEVDMVMYPCEKHEVPEECDFLPVINYRPIVLMRKDNLLANKKDILLSDIQKFDLLRIDPHLITLPTFEEIIRAHNLKSSIEFELGDWEILKKFVKAKIGVALISNICLEGEEDSDLIGIPVTRYFPEMTYGILVKKGKQFNDRQKFLIDLLTKDYKEGE